MQRTVLFGGSFDPPHRGHERIIKNLCKNFDRVIVVPAFVSPFKNHAAASKQHRLEMLRILIAECGKNAEISEFELEKEGTSYSYLTAEHFFSPSGLLYFAIGSEEAPFLPKWKNIDVLCSKLKFVVFQRENFELLTNKNSENEGESGTSCVDCNGNCEDFIEQCGKEKSKSTCENCKEQCGKEISNGTCEDSKQQSKDKKEFCTKDSNNNLCNNKNESDDIFTLLKRTLLNFEYEIAAENIPDLSSSLIKVAKAFSEVPSVERFANEQLPKAVFDYIKKHGLYNEYDELARGLSTFNLSEHRKSHTFFAIKAGIELAKIHGESTEKTIIALILHDIAKSATGEILEKFGINSDEFDYLPPQLRHAELSACIAKKVYGVQDEDVLCAIRFHTTGRPAMSRLEKIVAVADYIEETRDFPQRIMVKERAKKNLDCAMVAMLQCVKEYLSKSSAEFFPRSEEALNYYKKLV